MDLYEPLDLCTYCNSDGSAFAAEREPRVGCQTFRGLPFRIGDGEARRHIVLGGCQHPEPIAIAVGRKAKRLIFAHALITSALAQGDPVGRPVARYSLVFEDGDRVDAPVRERFEIAAVGVSWGEPPFIAVPDCEDEMLSRYAGKWHDAGFREAEVRQATARSYHLWDLVNPRADATIDRVEIHPCPGDDRVAALSFVLGGITLSHADEEPFRNTAAVPVKLTLPNPQDATAPFALTVEVDRGVANYTYALPENAPSAFLEDTHKGFGERQNPSNSPAYVEIAAIPSATVTVKKDAEVLGAANWGELEEKGSVTTDRVHLEIVDTGRNWVHTTVLDDETGKPIPCRIHYRTPDGIPYAPHGHHPHVHSNLGSWHSDIGGDVRLGQISYAYIDGKCQGWLPRGELIVDVARGYEYEPLRARVELKPGQRELTLRIRRHAHLNAARYFSGDTHVHFLSTQGALIEAAAEDLDVVNLLQSQWGHLFTNTEEFTGQPAIAGDGETIVYAAQENRQHVLGHLTLLGLKSPVMPWCSDGPSEAEMGGNMETTLSHWADSCHAQGGTVVIPHLPNPNGEPATLIATGRADAVEMLVHNPFFHLEYYRYLNGGYRLPLAGGTDKMDSSVPVGLYRTYAYIPPDEPFTYENWLKALRSGNTFLSGGPLLQFTVNGQPIGSTVLLGRDGGTVEVEATATSILPVHTLEIVQGGRVVASTEEAAGSKRLHLSAKLRIEGTTWLCARCAGPNYTSIPHHDTWRRGIMGHTSPIYLACAPEYDLFSPETAHYMLTLIDGSLQYIRNRAARWRPGSTTHHHGLEDHEAFLESPFREAMAVVHKRMHQHGIPH